MGMDDWVIVAKSRFALRKAIKVYVESVKQAQVKTIHPDKSSLRTGDEVRGTSERKSAVYKPSK